MAHFIKCKQELVTYKTMKQEIENIETIHRVFLGTRQVVTYKEVFDKEENYENSPINLDVVIRLSKTVGAYDRDSNRYFIKTTGKQGICFHTIDGTYEWYYDTKEARDEQFEEIASNSHMYKSKVVI